MKHADFESYLPRYFNGALSEAEKDQFELHAADCLQCVEAMHQAIDERDMVDLYAKNKLSEYEKEFFERHYFTCQSCLEAAEDAEALVGALRVAAMERKPQAVQGKVSLSEWLKKTIEQLLPTAVSPAYALAVLLLLLIYPAWRGLVELPRVQHELSRLQQPQANSQIHTLLPMRGAQETLEPIIKVPPMKTSVVPIILQFMLPDKAAEDSRLRAVIEDRNSGKLIWEEKELRGSGEYEVYAITCLSSFFAPGRFQLKVEEIDRSSERVLQEFVFPFEVAYN